MILPFQPNDVPIPTTVSNSYEDFKVFCLKRTTQPVETRLFEAWVVLHIIINYLKQLGCWIPFSELNLRQFQPGGPAVPTLVDGKISGRMFERGIYALVTAKGLRPAKQGNYEVTADLKNFLASL